MAALCAGLAVVTGLSAVTPAAPETDPVVVAAHDIASGETLGSDDVLVRDLPADAVASNAYHDADAVVGKALGGPVRRGETITDMRVVGSGLLTGYPDGSTLATVRIADPDSLWGIEVGTYVDIIGVDVDGTKPGRVLADDAPVVAMPEADAGATAGPATGVSLVVSVPADTAVELTNAGSRMQLGVIVSARGGGQG